MTATVNKTIRNMNKMTFLFSLFLTSAFLISCSNNSANKKGAPSESNVVNLPTSQQVDTTYMPTGFYFLADEKNDGIRMKDESSGEYYSLAKTPFASVTNIKQTKLTTTKQGQGDYSELCMTFDDKGTKELEDGTGNPLHSKMAVVVVGKLLYVVDNTTKIKTGVMCIGLVGYSKAQMEEIKKAVDQKH